MERKHIENEKRISNEIQELKKEIITLKIQLSNEKQESYKYILRSQLLEKIEKDQQQQPKLQPNPTKNENNFNIQSNIASISLNSSSVILNKRIDDLSSWNISSVVVDVNDINMEYTALTDTDINITTNSNPDDDDRILLLLNQSSIDINNVMNKSSNQDNIPINDRMIEQIGNDSNTIKHKLIENTTTNFIHNDRNMYIPSHIFDSNNNNDVVITSKHLMQIQTER